VVAVAAPECVWYVAYGSNMDLARFAYYLAGGKPPGGARTYPGCRDPRPPERRQPVTLPGRLYFALESRNWTGGLALYDPAGGGETAARAHLVTAAQFSDLAAQEMYRPPGTDLDLTEVLRRGRAKLGPGRYETLVCAGQLDGYPMVTFTAPWAMGDVAWNKPAAAYLRHLASGLAQAHAWDAARISRYLAACPGAAGRWSAEEIAELVADLVP
jgi:hypothetical protein